MKKLIIVNGTMGVGKSTVCGLLLKRLMPGVWLDGDWCWNMNPFIVNDENKAMVISNITSLLRSYLHNSGMEYVLFSWVIHQEEILDSILNPLEGCEFELQKFTLICSAAALKSRMKGDVERGIRTSDGIARSIARLPLYEKMATEKIDVSRVTPEQTAQIIERKVRTPPRQKSDR